MGDSQGRRQAEERAGQNRNEEREAEDLPVQTNRVNARQILRAERQQQGNAPGRKQQSQRAARKRKQKAFRQ